MTITAEHAEAMRAGRDAQLAKAAEIQRKRQATYSHWVRMDARLWRILRDAEEEGGEVRRKAYDEWKTNLNAMPVLP